MMVIYCLLLNKSHEREKKNEEDKYNRFKTVSVFPSSCWQTSYSFYSNRLDEATVASYRTIFVFFIHEDVVVPPLTHIAASRNSGMMGL